MDGTRILSRTIPLEPLSDPLPDGNYGLICFKGLWHKNRYGLDIPNPFPWWASVVHFSDGRCDDLFSGSNVADILAHESLKEVLVIEMSLTRRRELDEMLAVKNIELIDI